MGLYGPTAVLAVIADAIWQWLNRPPSLRATIVIWSIFSICFALLLLN
jgi:hypothetical protein